MTKNGVLINSNTVLAYYCKQGFVRLMLENNKSILCDFKLSKKHKRKVMKIKTKSLNFIYILINSIFNCMYNKIVTGNIKM